MPLGMTDAGTAGRELHVNPNGIIYPGVNYADADGSKQIRPSPCSVSFGAACAPVPNSSIIATEGSLPMRALRQLSLAVMVGIAAVATSATAQMPDTLETRVVADHLNVPWQMLWGPDDHIWMSERIGRVSRVDPDDGTIDVLLQIPVFLSAEPGLLGMALDPDFPNSPYVYLVYNYGVDNPDGGDQLVYERLARYRYDAEADTLVEPLVLIDSIAGNNWHNGSRLLMLGDATMLMTTGDAGVWARAQDPMSPNGKTLRIALDGTVPPDNPWAEAPWPSSLVWTSGHRNPQGLTFGPNGMIYGSEHGENHDDEVNILERGGNYGWPNVTGPCNDTVRGEYDPAETRFCTDSSVVEPLHWWTPTVAPSGLAYYDSDRLPFLKGSLLQMTLGVQKPDIPPHSYSMVQLRLNDDGTEVVEEVAWLSHKFGRLRSICIAPDGRLFVGTSNRDYRAVGDLGFPRPEDDQILELEPGGVTRVGGHAGSDAAFVRSTIIPQPIRERAIVQLDEPMGAGKIRILDMSGRLVRELHFSGGNRAEIDRTGLPSGTYIVTIEDARTTTSHKITVQ